MKKVRTSCAALIAASAVFGCSGSGSGSPQADATVAESAARPHGAAIRADLEPVLSRSTAGLATTVGPSSAAAVDLDGRFQSAAMVRRNADGTLSTECFEDVEGAIDFAHGEGATASETH